MSKRYIIVAGVNGAGKSTLFQTNESFKGMPRINMDEIVRENGDWRNIQDVYAAGKIAVRKLNDFLLKDVSFNQETTLCGKSIVHNINKAKKLGYQIELYYVGVDSVEIAKERVKQRVKAGGHGIPEKDIERRYIESLEQLKKVLPLCDKVELFDNTNRFLKFATFINGNCVIKNVDVPQWASTLF